MAGTGKRKKAQILGVKEGTYRGVLVSRKGEKNPGIACEIGKWGGRGC